MTEHISTTAEPIPADDSSQPTDEWKGLTDPAERRRRQNRINQRAYRKWFIVKINHSVSSSFRSAGKRKRSKFNTNTHPKSVVELPASTSLISSKQSYTPLDDIRGNHCLTAGVRIAMLQQFANSAYHSYISGCPTADHLLTLTKVNVFRALVRNMELIGWSVEWMDDDAISPFNTFLPRRQPISNENTDIPQGLQPTRIQTRVTHHPWLDFFPLAKMRDNLIEAGDHWDDDQMCRDIMGFWDSSAEDAGLLVWGEPWDVRNWEVTEAFLKKWGFVVRGCPELMNATNNWRARRGEKLIFRYI
ncbi:hypothetical protein NUU61_009550 [Penicillium alfredii]|uniref:BZIP domain-containing protein n=1 Tax=Penicillium alfredii TaxID=1506179 RepID=A0A9W9JTQ4_9EURO|nr:uncharacterized protein NUU61_009550 [Penicillium alfredii]KAJ5081286.1 hypothetical protein NUU61_009550 [Penicillium alfredii]